MAIDEAWVKGKGGRNAIVFSGVLIVAALLVGIGAATSSMTSLMIAMSLQVIAGSLLLVGLLRARRTTPPSPEV